MNNLTNDSESLVLDWLLNIGTPSRPSALYVALHTEDPTEVGNVGEVTTGTDSDYVRKVVTFEGSGSQRTNVGAVSWTVNSGSSGYTVTHVTMWTASTSGTCIMQGELETSRALVADGVLTFNIGEISAGAD